MELGTRITKYRMEKGMSQYKLAKTTRLSGSTICRLESGEMSNPSLSTLIVLSETFNVTLDELVFGSNNSVEGSPQEKE